MKKCLLFLKHSYDKLIVAHLAYSVKAKLMLFIYHLVMIK